MYSKACRRTTDHSANFQWRVIMDSKRLKDTLVQIPLQILFLILTGLIAVFVMMIPGLIAKAIIWFGNDSSAGLVVGFDHVITGTIGLVASFISMYQFTKKPGVDNAIFAQRTSGKDAKLNLMYPIIIIAASMIVYFGICYLVDFQFIASPVQYFAPYFAKVVDTTEFGDIGIQYKLISFAILAVCEIPAMFLGYIKGFKERIAGNSLV